MAAAAAVHGCTRFRYALSLSRPYLPCKAFSGRPYLRSAVSSAGGLARHDRARICSRSGFLVYTISAIASCRQDACSFNTWPALRFTGLLLLL